MANTNTADDVKIRYLEILKKCSEAGIRIIIDDVEVPEEEWCRIFGSLGSLPEEGGNRFYLADFIAGAGRNGENGIREIRFQSVCIDSLTEGFPQ